MGDDAAPRPAAAALAGQAATAAPHALLGMVRQLRARERGHLASLLHDGPIQELAAMALELGEVRRALGIPQGGEFDGIVRHVEAAGRELSRIQDELWPFPRPASGLIETLKRRTAWLLATPLAVAGGEGVAALGETDVQAVADVAELILAGLGRTGAWDRPIIVVRADPDLIFLELNMTPVPARDPAPGGPEAVRAWLHTLAAAIGARADVRLDDRRLRMWMEIPRWAGDPASGASHAGC
jgi:hypothetical protein